MTEVLSRNRFDLLNEEDAETNNEKVQNESEKKTIKKKEVPKPHKSIDQRNKPDNTRAVRNEYSRPGGFRAMPEGGLTHPVAPRMSRGRGPVAEETTEEGKKQRTGIRGGQRGGRGGPRGGFQGRGREYERHSATGRRDGEKKDVAGKGSWGAPGAEWQDEPKPTTNEDENKPPVDGERQAGEECPSPVEEKEVDQEDKVKTLNEYFQELQTTSKVVDVTRRLNEGAEDAQWKNAKVFERKNEEVFFVGKVTKPTAKKAAIPVSQPKKVSADHLLGDIRVADDKSRGRGRGQRGRGGRGDNGSRREHVYEGYRRNNRAGHPADLKDEMAFPSLK